MTDDAWAISISKIDDEPANKAEMTAEDDIRLYLFI